MKEPTLLMKYLDEKARRLDGNATAARYEIPTVGGFPDDDMEYDASGIIGSLTSPSQPRFGGD